MALRAVTDHPKFSRLKMLLKLNKSCALGYLEALWHFCGKYTPQGNVGKYSDADIEAWLEWDGDEGALIAACVKAGWLAEDRAHRLIVHDWSQYADDIVHTDLARKCVRFADGNLPRTGRLNRHERERFHAAFPGVPASRSTVTPDVDGEAGRAESDCGQTESDTSQTKPAAVTKPEPEPEPAEVQIPPLPPASGGASCGDCDGGRCTMNCGPCVPATAEDRAELADVNAMRARAKPVALSPLTWGEYAAGRTQNAKGTERPGGRRPRAQRMPRSAGYAPRAPV